MGRGKKYGKAEMAAELVSKMPPHDSGRSFKGSRIIGGTGIRTAWATGFAATGRENHASSGAFQSVGFSDSLKTYVVGKRPRV